MKAMKKVVSTVLLICMMAALMSVSAFAAATTVALQKAYIVYGPGDSSVDVSAEYKLDAVDLDKTCELQWWITNNDPGKTYGVMVGDVTLTDANGVESFTYNDLAIGKNYIEVRLLVDGVLKSKDTYTIERNTTSPQADPQTVKKTVTLNKTWIELAEGDSSTLVARVNGVNWDPTLITWVSDDASIASVDANGDVTAVSSGTTTIRAYLTGDASAVGASCTVVVKNDTIDVRIVPIDTDLKTNVSYTIVASLIGENTRFRYWRVESGMESYVRIANSSSARTTLTPLAASNTPIRLYAHVTDGKNQYAETYIEFTISAAESLKLEASPNYVLRGLNSVVQVVNAQPGETFTWNVVPTGNNLIAGRENQGNEKIVLTAGAGEGSAEVTVTSNYGRKASVTVFFNMEASFGLAKITPAEATWTPGQGNLTFEVSPAYYNGYIDGKLLTPQSGYYTYYGGVLTIKTSLLSQLSPGVHTLKVNTSSGNGKDGLVYATIRVTGSASSVYGDNTHVRGSAYNLYFNSTDPIKEVYISNQWIDPANYSLDSTGKRLTLNANFLNQLGYGTYTMKLVTENGYTETANFRIVTANYAPATGDNSNLGAWTALMILSCVGAVVLIPKKKSTDLVG